MNSISMRRTSKIFTAALIATALIAFLTLSARAEDTPLAGEWTAAPRGIYETRDTGIVLSEGPQRPGIVTLRYSSGGPGDIQVRVCNTYRGTFETNGRNIAFAMSPASTSMVCPSDSSLSLEGRIVDGLRDARKFTVRGAAVDFMDDKGKVVLSLAR